MCTLCHSAEIMSSLEVPTNSSRHLGGGAPARTSMSESLAEEEEEVSMVVGYGFEQFIVVETSEVDEDFATRPPGSPASSRDGEGAERLSQDRRYLSLSDGRESPIGDADSVQGSSRPSSRKSSFVSTSRASRYSPVSLTRQPALVSCDYSSPPSSASDAITYILLQEEFQSPDVAVPSDATCTPEPPPAAHHVRSHPPAPCPAQTPPQTAPEEPHNPPPPAPPAETESAHNLPSKPSHQSKVRKITPNGCRGSSSRGSSARNKVSPAESSDGGHRPASVLTATEAKCDHRDDHEAKARRASGNSVKNGRVVGERAKKTSSSSSSSSSTSSSSATRDVENNKVSSGRALRGNKGSRTLTGEKTSAKVSKGGEAASKGGKGHAARTSRHGGRGIKGRQSDSRGRNKGLDLESAAEHQSADSAIQLSALDASDRSNGSDGAGQQRQRSPHGSHRQSNGVHQREMATGSSSGSLQTTLAEDARRNVIDAENLQAGNSLTDIHRNQHHIKHGLSSSVESGIILDTPNSAPCNVQCRESYDIFLTELSKTLPFATSQAGEPRSPKTDEQLIGSTPYSHNTSVSPPSLSYRISCSAIVHREGTPSPDPSTSPFDAQESRL
ncbi:uncharacterized protein DDB_G0271670-like [Penaeus japonicus]|uniref:uncharacterized protein DDB_G0271670-like n=1 Tax=Penaeus japonicus TaxID=27405 RepID=UPI001C7179CC|nr:uncharacterized protein DDB_G0271670-like [Penaeus japonicus]